ncbi:hypothetical protein NDU88_003888 [Pleurodeles waltl]|uniref:L1 transposable element RRM domain-containing protein n=1 Tax=Pleurodeles waltl TaxID=8319 RepID=A0AAV7UFD1_PLEWA|nr:hypothetical protein NDU88_003888 [Pleurodeles waltl]
MPPSAPVVQQITWHHTMTDPAQESTMDHILQEISAVGRRLEGMDNAIASLTAETKSICLDISGIESRVAGLEQRVTTVETHIASYQDRDQELQYLRSKMIDLEDRTRRDNVQFLGFPEIIERADINSFLRETLPKLIGIPFDPPLEFRRAHKLGPKRPDAATPLPIIACLLRHTQAHQLLKRARTYGPCWMDGQEIRMSADFSKETSECRRAFLAFRPRLRQIKVKYGLFEPARMWITKNGVSEDFYDPEDLRSFLDSLMSMDITTPTPPQDLPATTQNASFQSLAPGGSGSDWHPVDLHPRGRDLERLMKNHDDRGQVLHAVAIHTQVTGRDKSRSPLKPTMEPT